MIDDIRLEDIQVTESNGNVFADLGLPNPEEALAKAELAIAINRLMEERGLTERQAAAILGTSQSRLHNVRRGRLTGVSTDWLLHALNRFGLDVEISVKPKPQYRTHARTTVASRINAGASRR
jgi:predicted XRE-type DNA-binding protein